MEIDSKIAIFASTVIVGVCGWVAKHITNSKKHPCKDDIVFKDVCDETQRRLEDCVESEAKLCQQRYESLTKQVDSGFAEVKQLIKEKR